MTSSRRGVIPFQVRDLAAWPCPDIHVLARNQQSNFLAKRDALIMYNAGESLSSIKKQTGKSRGEVYRLVRRCLTVGADGDILGFHALMLGTRVASYTRTKVISGSAGAGSAGFAGALTQLFERYPDVEQLVCDLFFQENQKNQMQEARISFVDIHAEFKKRLRSLGLTDNAWPFNTTNCGYKSLVKYCNRLESNETQRAMGARHGREAAHRASVGNGFQPLLPKLRYFGAAQLDFHKVDAASVIVLKNDHGQDFDVPLSRWHFGLLVEEKSSAALGFCVALELTPSSDSTLETISSALFGEQSTIASAVAKSSQPFLLHQLMPELSGQCFSILKVDNAWSNAAHEVVNNIVQTVGCAVNFGPVYTWWRRPLIERIFGELTRRGMQRLPSTYGKGPGDSKVSDPVGSASKFRISLDDLVGIFKRCLRDHNLAESEGLQWTSPIRCLQSALANQASGLFRQPLPHPVQKHPSLMMHVEEVTVLGNKAKNVRPYFNLDRHKHTNPTLASSFWLIGKKLIVYVDRRLARVVYATVLDTGDSLGRMSPSGPWAQSDCSWRDRRLMNRAGLGRRLASMEEDPLDEIKQVKIEQLKSIPKGRRSRLSRTALETAKIDAQQERAKQFLTPDLNADKEINSLDERPVPRPTSVRDTFSLNEIPNID